MSLTIIRLKSPERSAQTDVIQRTAEKVWYISASRSRVPRFGTRKGCFRLLQLATAQKRNDPAYRSFSCRFSRFGIAQAKLGSALGLSKTLIYRIVCFLLRNLAQQKRSFKKDLVSGKRDSNSRPSAWEADALPTELFPQCERKDTRKKRRNQISGEKNCRRICERSYPILFPLMGTLAKSTNCVEKSGNNMSLCSSKRGQSIFSTARNADCGTSTLPIWRMRFLPFFCFSSSLRLREISPP